MRGIVPCAVPVLALLWGAQTAAGEKPKSVVFKNFAAPPPSFINRENRITSDLWRGFQLLRDANGGDPLAQHELGLRCLLGEGMRADTAQAALWIGKAADQKLAVACYNYGVLLNNGMGVRWNPYEAYRRFQYAAAHRVPQADYMLGVFLSDDLALRRDIPAAYRYFKAAADSGFAPAAEVLAEFAERGWIPKNDSGSQGPLEFVPVPDTLALAAPAGTILDSIPADRVPDSIPSPTLERLRKEVARNTAVSETGPVGPETVAGMRRAAEWGSPEALTFLGRCAEEGAGMPRDSIAAAVFYLQAMRLSSTYAPLLLYRLVRAPGFLERLRTEADRRNPTAEYCWAALAAFGFGPPLTEQQALRFLESAAAGGNTDATLALAACYHSGTWVRKDHGREQELLGRAASTAGRAARLQDVISSITERGAAGGDTAAASFLRTASDSGSVLAQQMLGYCYENGIVTGANEAEAVRYYRMAAQRGNAAAYDALHRMYDRLRPKGKEFAMPR